TRVWNAIDACGKARERVEQAMCIIDKTPPVIGTVANATVECTATPTFTAPTATDACSGATVQQVGSDIPGGSGCSTTLTRVWNAIDACGNTSGTVSQTIFIIDKTPPV